MSPSSSKPTVSARLALLLYLFANLALVVLKVAHRPGQAPLLAHWSWWRVTGLLWGPWALTLAGIGCVFFWRLAKGGRRV